MAVTVKLNGRPYECPTSWMDPAFTTAKYIRVMSEWDPNVDIEKRDFFRLFCMLTGAEFKAFSKIPEHEAIVWACTKWIVDERFKFSEAPPRAMQIGDRTVMIPEDPGHLSIGQNIMARKSIEGKKSMEECIAAGAAIYLQPLYDDGKFNPDRVADVEKLLLGMPAYLVYPVGFFLLRRALSSGKTQWGAARQMLTSLIRTFARMRHAWQGSSGLFHTTTWR